MVDTNQGPIPDDSNQDLPPPPPSPPLNWSRLKALIIERKIDFALWLTRLLTIMFAAGYILPLFG